MHSCRKKQFQEIERKTSCWRNTTLPKSTLLFGPLFLEYLIYAELSARPSDCCDWSSFDRFPTKAGTGLLPTKAGDPLLPTNIGRLLCSSSVSISSKSVLFLPTNIGDRVSIPDDFFPFMHNSNNI